MATTATAKSVAIQNGGKADQSTIQPTTAWAWSDAPELGETDAATAAAARPWRAHMRLGNLGGWQSELTALPHYDPDYAYDPEHEYAYDWSTDPDYRGHVQHMREFNKDGFLMPRGLWHDEFLALLVRTLCAALGFRVAKEPELYFPASLGESLRLYTKTLRPKTMVVPDALVLHPDQTLAEPRERTQAERTFSMQDANFLTPDAAIEIVSPTSDHRDFTDKSRLYAAMGIKEYLILQVGEPDPESDAPQSNMWLFRLDDGGMFQPITDVVRICGTKVRIHPPDELEPSSSYLQWFDEMNNCWRDHIGDKLQEERIKTLLATLKAFVPSMSTKDQDTVKAHWLCTGIPENIHDRIRGASQTPETWRTILGVPDTAIDTDSN
jgi:hypothetical protein